MREKTLPISTDTGLDRILQIPEGSAPYYLGILNISTSSGIIIATIGTLYVDLGAV